MALEKWELELRKQLEEVNYDKPREQTWEDKLREQISNIQLPSHKMHKPNNVLPFVALIVVLLCACLGAYNMKTGVLSNWFHTTDPVNSTNSSSHEINLQAVPENNEQLTAEVQQLRIDFEKMRAEDSTRYAEVLKKVKWNGDRINLLGMINNENVMVITNKGSKFLYLNENWTLSGMPQYLELTETDKEFLQKYQKK